MKYIRTKDGEIYETKKLIKCNDERFTNGWFTPNQVPLVAIKQADTIEDLCDEFVLCKENAFHELYCDMTEVFDRAEDLELPLGIKEYDEQRDLISSENHWLVYGAIWTDKGLIYVTKMNDKGELELL